MGLSSSLADSYTRDFSETPKCHQKIDMIALKICKGLNQWALVPLWKTLIPTTILKYKTVTKNLR